MAEEETEEEVEAAIAVYGADCTVIRRSPPYLVVRLQPRTANDISQQYPSVPPMLELKDTKGLEDGKVSRLLSELRELADELTSNPMLVAICEKALDRLTEMNQPDGNCCFCMEPLVMENEVSNLRPFMKLLSCFHCFHSECFIRWWRWMLQRKNLDKSDVLLISRPEEEKDVIASCMKLLEEAEMKCPVCRKSINIQDMLSIWSILTADLGQEQDFLPDAEVIFSNTEIERKAKFDELFRAQQHRGGIIEPRKLEVIVPGMFVSLPSARADDEESGLASSTLQASESSSSSADARGELLQVTDNVSLGGQQTGQCEDSGRGSKSSERFNNPLTQKKGRRPNHTGAKKGYWVRRDHEGSK
ncbi:hypothetical protein GOP47_0007012 [Adiantum capillus-veneris]|uniref:Uncharacterized protein n=1 Tax=Adiantum capillus-veneris TaxID=13818 RepID=A0A9D4V034_ADICA|nr:hypothetical protein GOP47_0007012 [Adiantum capillus-veneris]